METLEKCSMIHGKHYINPIHVTAKLSSDMANLEEKNVYILDSVGKFVLLVTSQIQKKKNGCLGDMVGWPAPISLPVDKYNFHFKGRH